MEEQLYLKVPTKSELYFKKELKEDPATMNYNAGYDVHFNGYNYNDGTIKTDLCQLENEWFPKWVNNWPDKCYYFIAKKSDDKFIGEIYAKWDKEKQAYEIGIVIKGEHRGKGYSTPSIKLLCEKLKELGVKKLYHLLPTTRIGAIKAELNNGFKIIKEKIPNMLKFGKMEYCTLLEKQL